MISEIENNNLLSKKIISVIVF